MDHHHGSDLDSRYTQEFWDERYACSDALWSGDPNIRLVDEATDLAPGKALDVGSGEGADAIWLASRGWTVTGVDVSTVALDRAATRAEAAGRDLASRITWQQADILSWVPPASSFDLVSCQYMHLPEDARRSLNSRLAAAVTVGGTLLIVAHHPSDLHTAMERPDLPELFFTADEIATDLDPDDWKIVSATSPGREAVAPSGETVTVRDAVLVARRLR